MKYHVNPETGNPGICKAKNKCRFGDLEADHYASKEEARAAFEASMGKAPEGQAPALKQEPVAAPEEKNLPRPYEHYTTETLADLEEDSLAAHKSSGEPLSDDEYERRREYIRRISRENPSTHKENTVKVKGKTVYTAVRMEQQNRLVAELLERYEDVPAEGKVIMSGGMPGSGKTTLLRNAIDLDDYAMINPDEVKELMAAHGMTPKIKAVLPLETDELIKYEAQLLNDRVYEALSNERKNLIIDKTLVRIAPVLKDLDQLAKKGYTDFRLVFADVDRDTVYKRIVKRHRDGVDNWLATGEGHGERVTPGSALVACRTDNPSYKSTNAEVAAELTRRGFFNGGTAIYDTTDGQKELDLNEFLKGSADI